ncbi:MAG: CopG family transcriptional regulator [Candidatus Thermoplasmatota archaeon]|nr:CopG family transcriptional regulator [Candidatus Thermoplasmatota archaeon]
MESLLDKYNFESISDIIRMALRQFMEKYDDEGINKKVEVQLTRKMVDDLNSLLARGDAISIDDLIRSVLKEYTKSTLTREKERSDSDLRD